MVTLNSMAKAYNHDYSIKNRSIMDHGRGPSIKFSTSFNKNQLGKLVVIAKAFAELPGSVEKYKVINLITSRNFSSPTEARGYYCDYFGWLNMNGIVTYDKETKLWSKGENHKNYMDDVNRVMQNINNYNN